MRYLPFLFSAGLFLGLPTPSYAQQTTWPWYDDPISYPSSTFNAPVGNTVSVNLSVTVTTTAHHTLMLLHGFVDGNASGGNDLTWNNALQGWYNANANGTGTSLLVKVTSPITGYLAFNQVADASGGAQGSYDTYGQPTSPAHAYPYIDLGILPVGSTTLPAVRYTMTWGDGRTTMPTTYGVGFATVAQNPTYSVIPEPSPLSLLGIGGVLYRPRRRYGLSTRMSRR